MTSGRAQTALWAPAHVQILFTPAVSAAACFSAITANDSFVKGFQCRRLATAFALVRVSYSFHFHHCWRASRVKKKKYGERLKSNWKSGQTDQNRVCTAGFNTCLPTVWLASCFIRLNCFFIFGPLPVEPSEITLQRRALVCHEVHRASPPVLFSQSVAMTGKNKLGPLSPKPIKNSFVASLAPKLAFPKWKF